MSSYVGVLLTERSNIVVCLISPTYIASKVCQEEYNLAMALSCDPAYGTVLFPILVEPVDTLPTWCMDYPPLDMTKTHTSTFLAEVNLLKGIFLLYHLPFLDLILVLACLLLLLRIALVLMLF